ncbi:MAG: hypothetical protein AABZ57_02455, partial [Candidatus Margulisiibacteriota bacterium]
MNNFAQYLTEELSLEVKAADVKAFAKDKKSQDILPHLSISLGAASSNKNNLNLLPFEFASPLAYAALRSLNIYSVSAAYAVILFLIYAWFSYAVSGSAAREHKSLEAAYKSLNVASPGQNITPEMQNLLAAFSDKRHGERFASVMKELYSLTPDGIYFRSLDYSNSADKVVIKGVIVKRESSGISKFVKALKNGSIFRGLISHLCRAHRSLPCPPSSLRSIALLEGRSDMINLSPREKTLAFAVCAVLIFFAYWNLTLDPVIKSIASVKAATAQLRLQIGSFNALNKAGLPTLDKKIDIYPKEEQLALIVGVFESQMKEDKIKASEAAFWEELY